MVACSNFYLILILFPFSTIICGISAFTPFWYKEAGAYLYGIVVNPDYDPLNGAHWLTVAQVFMILAFSIHIALIVVLFHAFSKYRFEGLNRSNRWLFVTTSTIYVTIAVLELYSFVAIVIFLLYSQGGPDFFYSFEISADPFLALLSALLCAISAVLAGYIAKNECV